ncbi:MAG: hypothetical protein DSY42_02035 [Aquifex sp.]|nr:MAG: hypothetical protein DSY42_02035 [Aquifex sp.]
MLAGRWDWVDGADFEPQVFSFDESNSGVKVQAFTADSLECEFYNYFWDDNILEIIVTETNRYVYFMRGGKVLLPQSREHQWYDVTVPEMKFFLALVMLMGVVKKNNYRDYWSTDPVNQTPIFSKVMSVNRFSNILRALHFTDNLKAYANNTTEKMNKIRIVFDHLRGKFKDAFYPYKNVNIDESLMLWRGNISFHQYIPSKLHRFGLKLFALCDCKTGFVQDIVLYTGAGTDVTDDKSLGLSGAVVMTLMEPYLDKNHVLYVDNWYTGPALFEPLSSRETGGCGTVTKRRKHMPCFSPLPNKGDCAYKKAKNTLAVLWKDKREVTLLTTIHHPQMVLSHNTDRSTRQRIMKPECVLDYNTNMRLVDKADAMISSIECGRKTLKWYKKLFFHLNDVTMLNAHILFKQKTSKNPTLQEYVTEVVHQLLEGNAMERSTPGRHVADNPVRLTGRHFPRTM